MKNGSRGIVFDIHRFSLHDGPGIRTTVFLKGCPLKCAWCHNPESQDYNPQLSFNPEKCIDCFECVKACPSGTHKIVENKHAVDWASCTLSGNCAAACSYNALKIIGAEYSIDTVIAEAKKDIKFYNKSGGGITMSGGEPLAQFEFTKALLIAAKKEGLHTTVDTCGFAKEGQYKEILEYTDLFLFDYKLTDPEEHKKYTGITNKVILSNLEYLYKNHAHIILRFPIIPGINDTEDHLNGIASLLKKYPNLKWEIMPYHNMGRDKARNIGRTYGLNVHNASEADKQRWNSLISQNTV